jgi:hypothetical protein
VPIGDDAKSVADSLRELAATVNNLATKLDDLTVGVDRLAPLAPVANKLAAPPEKVTTLQSAAFDNTEQVKALNLALYRVESAQRDGKAHVAEDGGDSGETGKAPPKPPPNQARRESSRPSATNHRRGTPTARRKTTTPTLASTPVHASNSPRSTARRIRCRG